MPVKITILPGALAGALRPGLSVSVSVDVTRNTGPTFAEAAPRAPVTAQSPAAPGPAGPMTAAGVATAPTAAGARGRRPRSTGSGSSLVSGTAVGQFVAVLDIQIVASSLSQIHGISASADEMSWVQTIYLLAEVVIIPLTAYLTRMFGTRNFYVVAACAFMASSIATGLSTSIEMMIVTPAI